MNLIESAVYYSSKGLSVIPTHSILKDGSCDCGNKECGAKGKHPRLNWRKQIKDRLSDEELELWWRKYPNSNVGIVTGEISQVIVIDIDGEKGLKSLKEIGLTLDTMPPTPTARTGGGGYHLYYRYVKGAIKTRVNVLEKVDIRADGGIVIAPPSLHQSGKNYKWLKGKSLDDIPIADFDFSLLSKPDGVVIRKSAEWYIKILDGVAEGGRNEAATKLVGRWARSGLSQKEIRYFLFDWNSRNMPPLEESELDTVIESIYSKEEAVGDIPEQLEELSEILKIKVLSIKRIISDSDTQAITIEFDKGICTMSMTDLLSPSRFQREIASATNHIVRKLSVKSRPTHEYVVRIITQVSELFQADPEATILGETLGLITSYVKTGQAVPTIVNKKDKPQNGPFIYQGHIWMTITSLVRRSSLMENKIPFKKMSVRLKQIEMVREDFNKESYWGIPVEMINLKGDDNE